jgi:hypothetical protein
MVRKGAETLREQGELRALECMLASVERCTRNIGCVGVRLQQVSVQGMRFKFNDY